METAQPVKSRWIRVWPVVGRPFQDQMCDHLVKIVFPGFPIVQLINK